MSGLDDTADSLRRSIDRFGYSEGREKDRGELLEAIGYALEALIRSRSEQHKDIDNG